jgi:hypothetical protein
MSNEILKSTKHACSLCHILFKNRLVLTPPKAKF